MAQSLRALLLRLRIRGFVLFFIISLESEPSRVTLILRVCDCTELGRIRLSVRGSIAQGG
jgi:hypothetical protein